MEKTFFIYKPDSMQRPIIQKAFEQRLKDAELVITATQLVHPTKIKMLLKKHYAHIVDKPFYPAIEAYMTSCPILIGTIEGTNAVEKVRIILGATDPRQADPTSIRGQFGNVDAAGNMFNCVHASDSVTNAEKEIALWFAS